MQARRLYKPPICGVFNSGQSKLVSNEGFRFDIDPAAERELPHIIANKVQSVVACDSAENSENYSRQRKIGVVFFRRSGPRRA